MYFTNGGQVEGEWEKGQAVDQEKGSRYQFKDGLEYSEDKWEYCDLPDRRFYSERCNGIKPAGIPTGKSSKQPNCPYMIRTMRRLYKIPPPFPPPQLGYYFEGFIIHYRSHSAQGWCTPTGDPPGVVRLW